MIAQQHQSNEFHPTANGQRARRHANKWLSELTAGIDDPMWQQQVERQYYNALRCGHKLGVEGSLIVAQAVQ